MQEIKQKNTEFCLKNNSGTITLKEDCIRSGIEINACQPRLDTHGESHSFTVKEMRMRMKHFVHQKIIRTEIIPSTPLGASAFQRKAQNDHLSQCTERSPQLGIL